MPKIFYRKRDRQISEGLYLFTQGIETQKNISEWRLSNKNSPIFEKERIQHETLLSYAKYILDEINKIQNGELHF